ncbi:MAG: methyltransferase domain-containing protein [Gammaproteobacteria bacterium]
MDNSTATALAVRYRSWMASHEHVAWIAAPSVPSPSLKLPRYRPELVRLFTTTLFNDSLVPLKLGRFYPAQVLKKVRPPISPLFRVRHIDGEHFQADFNHPVALQEASLCCVRPSPVPAKALERRENVLKWLGMEAPLPDRITDFADTDRFERSDATDDAQFYTQARRVHHLDGTCRQRIEALYDKVLPCNGVILDLMSGWRSHLPARAGKAVGLGMNAQEMADNPLLSEYLVHDLNRCAELPFATGSFAATVNTASVEYLVRPHAVLREVRRILRPGGVAIFAFSNRYFPSKAIKLWSRLHPIERLGWVVQSLHQAGFVRLHTYVEHGLARAPDDRYTPQLMSMDPLLATWGYAPSPCPLEPAPCAAVTPDRICSE